MAISQPVATVDVQQGSGDQIDTDAFKKLYPQQYFERFFREGVRPDGRTLGRARPVSIGLGTLTNSLGSCLVKLGTTVVLAGTRATARECADGKPDCGVFKASVELAPFATADTRSTAAQEMLAAVSQRLQAALEALALEKQLLIKPGKSAFHLQLDIYILNADGSVLDAALLAAIAALSDTRLPDVKESKEDAGTGATAMETANPADSAGSERPRQLQLSHVLVAVSCALFKEHVLVDPTGEEEAAAHAAVCVVLDAKGLLHGVYKSGGSASALPSTFTRCIEAAKLRYSEVVALLQQQLELRQTALASGADNHGPAPMEA